MTRTLTDFLLARIAEDETAEWHDMGACSWANDTTAGVACDCGVPARVLAECAAKRRIVDNIGHHADHEAHDAMINPGTYASDIVKMLAAVYADHPDYRDEWPAS